MIFYFSGTGNSKYIAKKLAESTNSKLIDMSIDRNMEHEYHLDNNESVGFVFPVYYYTLNNVILDFVKNLKLTGNGYTYAIVTCGGSIGGTGGYLKSELGKRNINLDNVYPLVMPDNAVFYYNVINKGEAINLLKKSDIEFEKIFNKIINNEIKHISSIGISKIFRPIYFAMSGTKKFKVTDKCIGCGKCDKNCPAKAIEMKNGIPVWSKSHCDMCSACINRCPVEAIQYGKGTTKRNRYENPYV